MLRHELEHVAPAWPLAPFALTVHVTAQPYEPRPPNVLPPEPAETDLVLLLLPCGPSPPNLVHQLFQQELGLDEEGV